LGKWLVEVATIRDADFALTSCIPNISGRHRLSSRSDSLLTFDWYIDGCKTALDVQFESVGDLTTVKIDHRLPEPLPKSVQFPGGGHYGKQAWDFALYRLKFYLEVGRRAMQLPWPDDPHTIRHEIDINASAKAVWQVLADHDHLNNMSMMMDGAAIEPRLGGRYSFGWKSEETKQVDGPGHITIWEAEERLHHTWHGGRDSEIHWQLKQAGDTTTRLTFEHTGLIFPYAEVWSYKLGWAEHLMEIKHYLERGTAIDKA